MKRENESENASEKATGELSEQDAYHHDVKG
jgi:hypothetical protein